MNETNEWLNEMKRMKTSETRAQSLRLRRVRDQSRMSVT